MKSLDEIDQLLAELEKELAALNVLRSELLAQITELRQEKVSLLGAYETQSHPDRCHQLLTSLPKKIKSRSFAVCFVDVRMSTQEDSRV